MGTNLWLACAATLGFAGLQKMLLPQFITGDRNVRRQY